MPPMNCTEFEQLLDRLAESRQGCDAEDPQRDVLMRQAEACDHCAELWNRFAVLERAIPAWVGQTPQIDMADAVLSRWDREEKSALTTPVRDDRGVYQSPRLWIGVTAVLALAVAVPLLMKTGGENNVADNDPQPATKTLAVAAPDEIPQPAPDPDEPPELTDLALTARSAYLGLANEARTTIEDAAVFLPDFSRLASAEPQPKPKPTNSPSWFKDLKQNLDPIRRGFDRSLEYFRESMPDAPVTL